MLKRHLSGTLRQLFSIEQAPDQRTHRFRSRWKVEDRLLKRELKKLHPLCGIEPQHARKVIRAVIA